MITRRAFLSALAALPLVGRWMPADPMTTASYASIVPNMAAPSENSILITAGNDAYWLTPPCDQPLHGDCLCEWHRDYRFYFGDECPDSVRAELVKLGHVGAF